MDGYKIGELLDRASTALRDAEGAAEQAEWDEPSERQALLDDAGLQAVGALDDVLDAIQGLRDAGSNIDEPPRTEEARLLLLANFQRIAENAVADCEFVADQLRLAKRPKAEA